MPAPGGSYKGSASSSTGYAGNSRPGGTQNQGSGGKMGSGSSQSGGTKSSSSGGKMGSGSSQSGGVNSGPKSSGPGGAGGVRGGNGTGSSQRQAATSSQVGNRGGGGLQGVAAQSRSLADRATGSGGMLASGPRTDRAPSQTTGGLLGSLMQTTTPRTHPFRDPARFNYPQTYSSGKRVTELQRQAALSGLSLPDQLAQGVPARNLSMLANLQSAWGKPIGLTSVASQKHSPLSQHHGGVKAGLPGSEIANAFDMEITGGPGEQTKMAQLARDMGFNGVGTYGPGPFRDMVHVDARSRPGTWGGVAKSALGGYQPSKPDMEAIAAGMRTPSYGAPSLADAMVASSSPKIQDRLEQERFPGALPQPKPEGLAAAIAARNVLAGLGSNPARAYPGAPSPNMDMAGYDSPMAGVGGMPQAPANYTGAAMAQYNMAPSKRNSIMEDDVELLANGEFALSRERRLNERNVTIGDALKEASPGLMDAIRATPPSTNVETYTGYNRSRSPYSAPSEPPLASQGPGLLASPNVNLGRSTPNMNMAGYNSPMAGVGSLPSNPQSAGMSFNPGMPRNPVSGMAFNPDLPAQQQQVARGIPNQVGREAYDPLGSIRAPQGGTPQAMAQAQPPAGGGFFAGLGDAVQKAGGLVADTVTGAPGKIRDALTKAVMANPNDPNAAKLGGWSNPLNQQNAMRDIRGGAPDGSWMGNEPPQVVAQMQQHVEEVLRQYLTGSPAAGVA